MLKRTAVVVAFVGLMAGFAYAGSGAGTGINGSMHDINSAAGYTGDVLQRSCVFCHTPHNAQPNGSVPAPLWNHAPSNVTLDPYKWAAPANQPIAFNADPLIGPSRLCMACHDGVTAVDSHGNGGLGNSAASGTTLMTSHYTDGIGGDAKRFVKDLTVTHPIGFLYQDALNERGSNVEIVPATNKFITGPTATLLAAGFDTKNRTIATDGKKISDTLYGGYMTCASCHEVHNTNNAKPDAGHSYNYFLLAKEEGSAICLSCHIK